MSLIDVTQCLTTHPSPHFFENSRHSWHKRPHDIPVIGMPECLLNKEWLDQIEEVIVALPEKDSARLQTIGEILKSLPLKVTFASDWPVLSKDHVWRKAESRKQK